MMAINGSTGWNDGAGNDVSRIDRDSVANEVGAAIVHQLNGPLTALLLYLDDLYQGSDRFPVGDCDGLSLKEVAENALREAERICALMRRLGDSFEAPLREQTAFAQGRQMIRRWSLAANADTANPRDVAAHQIALTMRESEVLRLIREGCSNKEGGVKLQISHRTFESHRARLMRKYGAKNVADLLRLAARDHEGCDSQRSASSVQGRIARPRRSSGATRCER